MDDVTHGEKFVNVLEQAYAPYKSTVAKKEVAHWANTRSPEVVRATYQELRKTFSNRYGAPPDLPDVLVAYRAIKDEVESVMALPDPDYEERRRTITQREKELGQEFFKRILEGMAEGVHPEDVYREWMEERNDDK